MGGGDVLPPSPMPAKDLGGLPPIKQAAAPQSMAEMEAEMERMRQAMEAMQNNTPGNLPTFNEPPPAPKEVMKLPPPQAQP